MTRLTAIAVLLILASLVSSAWAEEAANYRVRPAGSNAASGATGDGESGGAAEALMLRELEEVTEVVVAGEHLIYDEAAGRAEWTGDVRLTAGSLLLTTGTLVLTFDMDPVTGDQILRTLTAGPVVELTAEQGLAWIHGEALSYTFAQVTPEGEEMARGEVRNATFRLRIPKELLAEVSALPLAPADMTVTIKAPLVETAGDTLRVTEPSFVLVGQGKKEITVAAKEAALYRPTDLVTRLSVTNLRVQVGGHTVAKVPWTQEFTLRGPKVQGGLDPGLPKPVSANEGLGLAGDIRYNFGQEAVWSPWTIGVAPEWIFADRNYLQGYVEYEAQEYGQFRLYYGTERGRDPLSGDSIPVKREPELVWTGDTLSLADRVHVTPTLSYGVIDERRTGRQYDRASGTLDFNIDAIELDPDGKLEWLFGGAVTHSIYDDDLWQRISEVRTGLRYVEPGQYGVEAVYYARDDAGVSPFWHDRLELREEVAVRARALGSNHWGGAVRGRYDLRLDEWRDFDLGVSRRFEIVELTLYWRMVQEGIAFEVGLPGRL